MLIPAILEVKTFGGFSISCPAENEALTISEFDSFSPKLWGLLEYLVIFRKHGVTRAELIDAFWGDDFSENPDNNLKALIFRARKAIAALGSPFSKELIVCQNNGIKFSDAITFKVDVDDFEMFCIAAETAKNPNLQLINLLCALELYGGDFLPKSTNFSWAATLSVYYHAKYLKLCASAIALLSQANRHEEIITLCKKALTIEPYDEMLHRALIEAFVASGAMRAAMQHYTYVIDFFITELSVSPSKELTALYHKITSAESAKEMDLHTVQEKMREFDKEQAPFFCGYATFRDIYRLEARSAKRAKGEAQLVMLTLSGANSRPMSAGQIRSGMEFLMQAISASLRMSDVFSKFSAVQYLILLPSTDYENGQKAVERILQHFHKQHPKVSYFVAHMLLPVLPTICDKEDVRES